MNPLMIVLTTVLTLSIALNLYQSSKISSFESDVSTLSIDNKNLKNVITEQAKEIKEMPNKYIKTTRDMDKEICLGVNAIDKIMTMTPRKEVVKEGLEIEKIERVDIDGKLPDDLIKLLNSD